MTSSEIKRYASLKKCPYGCGGDLIHWGFYQRWAVDAKGSYRIPVARKRCKSCKRTCSFLPPTLMRYYRLSLEWFKEPMERIFLGAMTLQKAWEASPAIGDFPGLRSFRRVLERFRNWADTGESNVMAWMGFVAENFQPDKVPQREKVRLQTQQTQIRWQKLGLLVVTVEGLMQWWQAMGINGLSIMGLIQYCASNDWKEMVEGLC